MRSSQFTVNNRTGFIRVNDQIISYLRAVMASPTPGVLRVGYITIGIDFRQRKAAQTVIALSTDLAAVIRAIGNIVIQNIALSWKQVAESLPGMVAAGSKVIVITASEVPASERGDVAAVFNATDSTYYVIGLPFRQVLTPAGLMPLVKYANNYRVVTTFTDTSVRYLLEEFVPILCVVGTCILFRFLFSFSFSFQF